ncbi:MAG: hypothetical protein IPK95_08510 [Cellvibrionales bacterium]|nr:hypothetical protein [Cellvibrionales bacterium]
MLSQLESISVEQGVWDYRNPGKLIADAIGCPDAKSILATSAFYNSRRCSICLMPSNPANNISAL